MVGGSGFLPAPSSSLYCLVDGRIITSTETNLRSEEALLKTISIVKGKKVTISLYQECLRNKSGPYWDARELRLSQRFHARVRRYVRASKDYKALIAEGRSQKEAIRMLNATWGCRNLVDLWDEVICWYRGPPKKKQPYWKLL